MAAQSLHCDQMPVKSRICEEGQLSKEGVWERLQAI